MTQGAAFVHVHNTVIQAMFLKVRKETILVTYKEQVYYIHVLLKDILLTNSSYGMTVFRQADGCSYVSQIR
jgi:hypothetical protein